MWKTLSRGQFDIDKLCEEIKNFIDEKPDYNYSILIGSDSQKHGEIHKYTTAIVVHRVGNGAQYYYKSEEIFNIQSLKQKIIQEGLLTLKYRELLKEKLEIYLNNKNIIIESHIDVGNDGKTKQFINEVVGMLKGYEENEMIKIKPNASAASSVADRHTK